MYGLQISEPNRARPITDAKTYEEHGGPSGQLPFPVADSAPFPSEDAREAIRFFAERWAESLVAFWTRQLAKVKARARILLPDLQKRRERVDPERSGTAPGFTCLCEKSFCDRILWEEMTAATCSCLGSRRSAGSASSGSCLPARHRRKFFLVRSFLGWPPRGLYRLKEGRALRRYVSG